MYVGETPQFTFKFDAAFALDLNDAQEIEVKLSINGNLLKTFLKTGAAPSDVKVDGTGLIAHVNLQHADSVLAKPGMMLIQVNLKMPTSLYPEFPSDGFYSVLQVTEQVFKSI